MPGAFCPANLPPDYTGSKPRPGFSIGKGPLTDLQEHGCHQDSAQSGEGGSAPSHLQLTRWSPKSPRCAIPLVKQGESPYLTELWKTKFSHLGGLQRAEMEAREPSAGRSLQG